MLRDGRRGPAFWLLGGFFVLFVLFLYGPLSTIVILSFQGNDLFFGNAIKVALSLPWSNDQHAGQINKLKMLKRQMYSRAILKLREHRLICVA